MPAKKIVEPEKLADTKYAGKPIVSAEESKKVSVDGQIEDVQVTSRYPRHAQSANYNVEVLAPMTGIPTVRIAPIGWVGVPPLSIPESRIDELIQLLTEIR